MIFNEPAFFVALAVSVLVFRFLPAAAKPWWLFLTGILFYAYFSPAFVAVLLAEIVLVYVLGGIVRRRGNGATLAFAAGLVITIGLLMVYKYGGLLSSTATGAGANGLPTFEDVRLPLAISFFTFEFVHYLVDAREGRLPEHAAEDFLGFALFIPTMVAGPIKRFQGFYCQVREARTSAEDLTEGTTRILVGLAKKVVLADTLMLWTEPLTAQAALEAATRLDIVVALVAYSLRIYLDFSGYSDIAIGSARLFGLKVPENFAWPYLKTNIADFWRSWHISLTGWIRDYVYVPLGGSRCATWRQCVNLIAAFAVSGIWHGAAWNFLGWGLYHGTLMAGHRVYTLKLKPQLPVVANPLLQRTIAGTRALAAGVLTFSLVSLGWGLFAMPFSRFVIMLRQLVTGGM
ncbi:MAG TPA: MBOAT family O-acyltransferase [Coriobacteriia bacterium]|nr:MBOAT family O-acyltransferase [Coriobacteriia bacterium]